MNGSAATSLAVSNVQRRLSLSALMLVAALAVVACADPGSMPERRVVAANSHATAPAERDAWASYRGLLEEAFEGEWHVLRVRADTERARLWVLGPDHVDVYDTRMNQLVRRISLAGWSVADSICPPDLVLDQSGTAFISHNAEPKLWRVAADTLELTQHALRLVNREQLDIGFGALAFAQNGRLFGVAATGGSLWHIEIEQASARQVELDRLLPEACAPTVR